MASLRRIRMLANAVRNIMNDSERKPLYTIFVEIIRLWFRDRTLPVHYYIYLLYRRDSSNNVCAYVGLRNIARVRDRINSPSWTSVLDNKRLFDAYFRPTGIRLPKILGFNEKNRFVVGDDAVLVRNRERLLDVLKSLVMTSSTNSVFAKPTGGGCGRGCFMFDLSSICLVCADKGSGIVNGDYIYQEVIVQHPKMAELHPSSVNTLRIDTYRTDDGEVDVMSAFLRMGANKSCTDNVSSGGCFVGVDLETGRLVEKGFVLSQYKPSVLKHHPDTGVTFKDFGVPFFHEAVLIAKQAARLTPLAVVGWDLAIGPDGPILIEGNAHYDGYLSEMAYGGYYKNPVFRRLIRDHAPSLDKIARQFD
jgi:hypothetical protein